jgi:hypothetical protein
MSAGAVSLGGASTRTHGARTVTALSGYICHPMQLRLYKPVKSTRQCGGCTACCTALGVLDLHKPINVRCAHVCEAGCSVYADRPAPCSGFQCAWLRGFLADWMRPDQGGIVWDLGGLRSRGTAVVRAFLTRPDVSIEQVEYQLAKIQQKVAEPLACLVIPAGLSCRLDAAFHANPVRPNIMLADREATDAETAQGAVGKPPTANA